MLAGGGEGEGDCGFVTASEAVFRTFSSIIVEKAFFKILGKAEGVFSTTRLVFTPLGGTRVRIGDKLSDMTPEIKNAFTITRYILNTDMSDAD